jgi:hypothetical protein
VWFLTSSFRNFAGIHLQMENFKETKKKEEYFTPKEDVIIVKFHHLIENHLSNDYFYHD